MSGRAFHIPDAALSQHVILLGKTRAGKSSVMRGMVERLLDQGKPVCIIDPKGDWWGLKSSADGKQAGYKVIIFGGEHADVPLNAHSGAHVAELVATGNRPCIIDLGGWFVGERTRFFIDFASTLFRHTRGPRYLAIDEVHNFAPQGKVHDPDSGKMLHWANRLASEGAGKGITLISASQRPQKVHKDYLTSHETLIAMRVIHKLDRDAIADWIRGAPDQALGAEVMATLATMERGEGWAWSPEAKFGPKRIKFPMFSTYDSFAAPTSETVEKLKGWASVDLDDVRTKLAAVVEEAKANDPRALKTEVARLTRELAAKADKPAPSTGAPAWPDQREDNARLRENLRVVIAERERARGLIEQMVRSLKLRIPQWRTLLDGLEGDVDNVVRIMSEIPAAEGGDHPAPDPRREERRKPDPPSATRPRDARPGLSAGEASPRSGGDASLTGPQRNLLGALAWWKAMGHEMPTRVQVAAKAGWTPKGSNLRNRLAELSSAGLVDYPRTGVVRLTDAGLAAAPTPDTSETLIDSIRAVLTGPQSGLFETLLERADTMSRVDLATAVGWEPAGSNLRNRLAEMSALELVEYPGRGEVRLQDWVMAS